MFEVVREAYQAGSRDFYLFILDNGMSFTVGAEAPKQIYGIPEKMDLVYAKNRH